MILISGNGQYYVSTDGRDSNPGTIDEPWRTPRRALNGANTGDTVYFRGGTYYSHSTNIPIPHNGTPEKPICFFNYPDEIPVIDFSRHINEQEMIAGIDGNGSTYLKFRGITIQGIKKIKDYQQVTGIMFVNAGVIYLEDMSSVGHDGTGFYLDCDTLYINGCIGTKEIF